MSNHGHGHASGAVWLAVVVGLFYIGIWVWFKLTGQKPQMES